MKKTKKDIESEIKTLEDKLAKLKGDLGEAKKVDLNKLFKDYIHVWMYIEGYEDMSYLFNIDSVEYITNEEIGFAGTVIELGTVNTEHNGLNVKVATTDYKKYLHRFSELPNLDDYDEDVQSIKDGLDECISEECIEKITVEKARDIITCHTYWSIWDATENGVLDEKMNPMKEFNK